MSADKKSPGGFDSDHMIPGPERIVPPPQGALEEAVALADAMFHLAHDMCAEEREGTTHEVHIAQLEDFQRRRAALEPRLARRRENQAKARTLADECISPDCPVHEEPARRRDNQAKGRG